MDIRFDSRGPEAGASTLANSEFTFDGVECASLESLLQAFKLKEPSRQAALCKQNSKRAKKTGENNNRNWQKKGGKIHWNGIVYERNSKEYQDLLERIYDAWAENKNVKKAILSTRESPLLCSELPKFVDFYKVVLTRDEHLIQVYRLRDRLQAEK